MIVRKLLKIQSNIEDRKVPYDMNDADLNQHYSESKGQFQNILDMDLIHLIRSYSKLLHHRDVSNPQDILDNLDVIENRLTALRSDILNL
jgi:uncharacterized membrane-anchored protein YhcB (DUF1043 family)